jgi:hypothetical protein
MLAGTRLASRHHRQPLDCRITGDENLAFTRKRLAENVRVVVIDARKGGLGRFDECRGLFAQRTPSIPVRIGSNEPMTQRGRRVDRLRRPVGE